MSRLLLFIQTYWLVLTVLNLVLITALSLWPVEYLPKAPGSDKTHHLLAYALLMFPAGLRKPCNLLLVGLFFIGWSGVIELIQPYVNRYAEWWDLLANGVGVLSGYCLAWVVNQYLR